MVQQHANPVTLDNLQRGIDQLFARHHDQEESRVEEGGTSTMPFINGLKPTGRVVVGTNSGIF